MKSGDMIRQAIREGRTSLGIEFGSTRIKGILVDDGCEVIAAGDHAWENRYENGVFTYHLDDITRGMQGCYASLAGEVRERYGVELETVGSMGISAMMHGFLAFDKEDGIVTPFRTWRNVMTGPAAKELSELFQFNIPLRWSIAHFWQDVMDGKAHVQDITFMTTLAGYVHWLLTGEKVLGIGDASGMFPIDSENMTYDQARIDQLNAQAAAKGIHVNLRDILPEVRVAGENAGMLTEEGARLLDPSGKLRAGIPFCPPEGDAGTGMVATDSVRPRTGNVSAGTSYFAMVVLERPLEKMYPEIDLVTTPAGDPVAMVHTNTGTSDIDAWAHLFQEAAGMFGPRPEANELFPRLYEAALKADENCGGLMAYNLFSGEVITHVDGGAPLLFRRPDSSFTIANVMRSLLNSSLATLAIGMRILDDEHVEVDVMNGHGGFFKTERVGQQLMADALKMPVRVAATAGEGGAWGIAVLARFMMRRQMELNLGEYLEKVVFEGMLSTTADPSAEGMQHFQTFLKRYEAGLPVEKAAVQVLMDEDK